MKYRYLVRILGGIIPREIYAESMGDAQSSVDNMFLGRSFNFGREVATLERADGKSKVHKLVWGEGWEAV